MPAYVRCSHVHSAVARTRTSTCPGPGNGTAKSRSSSVRGATSTPARIVAGSGVGCSRSPRAGSRASVVMIANSNCNMCCKMLHMILRKLDDGGALAITQTDHSRLAGFFAAHWGNATFAAPNPYESVTRAAVFHDFGWLRYETRPEVDPASGEPYTFISLPFTAEQLEAYQWCVDWLAEVDPYS